jgi:hypothetical protein
MNAEKLGIIGLLGLVNFLLILCLIFLFRFFNQKIAEKDHRIEVMTGLLLESSSVLSRMTSTFETTKVELISAMKLEASRIITEITNCVRSSTNN